MPKPITNPDYYLTNFSKIAGVGTGYAVNDILTLSGGTFSTAATIRVTTVLAGGAISGLVVQTLGDYSVLPTNPVNLTGGTGTGATLTAVWVARNPGFTQLLPYRSQTSGVMPTVGTLNEGELFVNAADASIYIGNSTGTPIIIGGADIALAFAIALG